MNNEKRIKKLKENKYQELFGVKKETFDEMLKELNKAYEEEQTCSETLTGKRKRSIIFMR